MGKSFKKLAFGLVTLAFSFGLRLNANDVIPGVIGPFGGLNNTDSPFIIAPDRAQDLLNVDITPGGKSVKKRPGYGTAFTLAVATKGVHGVYKFFEAGGSDVILTFNDRYLSASLGGGSPTVLFSTGPIDATYQCTDAAGFAYCANTGRTSIIKTNGVTQSVIITPATGTMVALTPERLVTSGFSDFPSRIDFSKANDFTVWTPGGNATDPINFTIVSPGSKITHIVYAHGRIYWFKDSSFGYILSGQTQADWVVRTINSEIGTIYNTSIFRDDILYFQGNDGHFYGWDGSNLVKLSRDIQGTIDVTQGRVSNSWEQTSAADWNLGNMFPFNFLSSSQTIGSIEPLIGNVTSYFIDTSSINFSSGTLTNISTTVINGSITLGKTDTTESCITFATTFDNINYGSSGLTGRSFVLSSSMSVTSVEFRLSGSVGTTATGTYEIRRDDNSFPSLGTLIATSGQVSNSDGSLPAVVSSVGGSTIRGSFTNPVPLEAGTTYWFMANVSLASGQLKMHYSDPTCTTSFQYFKNGSGKIAGGRYEISINGHYYATSGNIVSRPFDVGRTTATWIWNWNPLLTDGTIVSSTTLSFETQTSSNSTDWASLTSVSTGFAPTSLVQRYIRYKATFGTSNISASPIVNSVHLSLTPSTLFSQVKNAPSLSTWDVFEANKSDSGGSVGFYLRASTSSFTVGSTTPTWSAISVGAIPTVSTGSYFQVRADFSADASTDLPSLQDFTVNWFEGGASDKTYAIYHDNALWWAVASGAGASTNNRILKFDLLNTCWLIYDLPMNGLIVRNQSLYFGSPSEGKVHIFGSTGDDDGEAINAYWKSKDFFADSPFLEKEIVNLSFAAGSVANSSMTVTYTMNGSSSTAYVVNLYDPLKSFIRSNKNLPQGKIGNTFNVKFGNNAVDQPFETFAIQYGYRVKSWIPTP